jgi:hypothetical protein
MVWFFSLGGRARGAARLRLTRHQLCPAKKGATTFARMGKLLQLKFGKKKIIDDSYKD